MNTPQPKIRFNAEKADGSVTTLAIETSDVLSAAVAIIGPGHTIELMDKDKKPIYRIAVSPLLTPDEPEKITLAPGREQL